MKKFCDEVQYGDMLIDQEGQLMKFIKFDYCKWIKSCKVCKGQVMVQRIEIGDTVSRCFGNTSTEFGITCWLDKIYNGWVDDKDFIL